MKQRFFQVTIICYDDMPEDGENKLTRELVEEGFRINPLPQFLKLHDVEAMELPRPFRMQPTPEDLKQVI